MHDDDIRVTGSSGNVFLDLGLPPEEAAILAMRADLLARLRLLIRGAWLDPDGGGEATQDRAVARL